MVSKHYWQQLTCNNFAEAKFVQQSLAIALNNSHQSFKSAGTWTVSVGLFSEENIRHEISIHVDVRSESVTSLEINKFLEMKPNGEVAV